MLTCSECGHEALPNPDNDCLSACCSVTLLNADGEPADADEVAAVLDDEAAFFEEYDARIRREER